MAERPDPAAPVDAGPDPERLRGLEERLAQARARRAPPPAREEHYSQANVAWRMVIELVSGIGIGFGMGLGLDALAGTRPLFLVLFTLLGFAAGVRVMLRTAQEIGRAAEHGTPALGTDEGVRTPGTRRGAEVPDEETTRDGA